MDSTGYGEIRSLSGRPLILAVDRNRRNLEILERYLGQAGYEVVTAGDVEELDRVLEGGLPVRVALVDLAGFDHSMWERCERLQQMNIPFLAISAMKDAAARREGIAAGARSVLEKPLRVGELLYIVRKMTGEG